MAKDHRFAEWKVKGAKCSFDWRLVISRGHIVESWRAELEMPSSISEFRRSRLGASRSFITGITMRSGLSDHWRSRPLIRLDEVHKFVKYEAPFGAAYGHRRWSREGKKLVVLSSISESRRSLLGVSRPFITGIAICKIAMRSGPSNHWRSRLLIRLNEVHKFAKYKAPFGAACGHAGGHVRGRS
jgi:hypothetical protein